MINLVQVWMRVTMTAISHFFLTFAAAVILAPVVTWLDHLPCWLMPLCAWPSFWFLSCQLTSRKVPFCPSHTRHQECPHALQITVHCIDSGVHSALPVLHRYTERPTTKMILARSIGGLQLLLCYWEVWNWISHVWRLFSHWILCWNCACSCLRLN